MTPTYFVFDLETTGTHPYLHGIHQLAGKIMRKGLELDRFNIRMRPYDDCEYDPEALKVCNITKKEIRSFQSEKEAYVQLMKILRKHLNVDKTKEKYFTMGYFNLHMDNDFLNLFMQRNAIKLNPYSLYFYSGALDVSVMALECLQNQRDKLENFKLATVAEYFGIKVNNKKLHGAEYDVELTWKVRNAVIRKRNNQYYHKH